MEKQKELLSQQEDQSIVSGVSKVYPMPPLRPKDKKRQGKAPAESGYLD